MRFFPSLPRGVRLAALASALCSSALLAACSSTGADLTSMLRPYRPAVIQGNFVSHEMAEEIKPGMSREQVQSILGTPLLKTIFNADRWEYVFSLREGYKPPIVRRFTVYFDKDGRVLRTDGDPLPSEEEFVQQINALRGSKPRGLSEAALEAEIAAAKKAEEKAQASAGKRPRPAASGPLTVYAPPAEIAALQSQAGPAAAASSPGQ